jgi:hypothetical protein
VEEPNKPKAMKHKENQRVIIDVWNSRAKEIERKPGTVTGIVSALDAPYRVNVTTDDGLTWRECHPDCVHPQPPIRAYHTGEPEPYQPGPNQLNVSEYRERLKTKTRAELEYIIKDAREALEALPGSPKAGYYQDEIHEAARELRSRKEEARKLSRAQWEEEMIEFLYSIIDNGCHDARELANMHHEEVKDSYNTGYTPEEAARRIEFHARD